MKTLYVIPTDGFHYEWHTLPKGWLCGCIHCHPEHYCPFCKIPLPQNPPSKCIRTSKHARREQAIEA